MQFLKDKFYDNASYLDNFLGTDNRLLNIEKSSKIDEQVKMDFVSQFTETLLSKGLISRTTLDSVDKNDNPWSIDFPSWTDSFDENRGKKILVIGAEPHIHFRFVQTVYGLNGENTVDSFIENNHPLFKYLSEIIAFKFNISKTEALNECYLTDLFPLSPMRGNGLSVGSADKLQAAIGGEHWQTIRFNYAREHLKKEIEGVKPELIITQGKDVLQEIAKILGVTTNLTEIPIVPKKGNRQFIRLTSWNKIPIISVPHIGSQRMRTFWNSCLTEVCQTISKI
jgi:hypothetical protein